MFVWCSLVRNVWLHSTYCCQFFSSGFHFFFSFLFFSFFFFFIFAIAANKNDHIIYHIAANLLTPTRFWGGFIFLKQFMCVSVFLSVNTFQHNGCTDFNAVHLNGFLLHWFLPYWNWWLWVNGQGYSDQKCISEWWKKIQTWTMFKSKSIIL